MAAEWILSDGAAWGLPLRDFNLTYQYLVPIDNACSTLRPGTGTKVYSLSSGASLWPRQRLSRTLLPATLNAPHARSAEL